ncbi:hypothetical protein D3C73_1267500 [compost metagenome]
MAAETQRSSVKRIPKGQRGENATVSPRTAFERRMEEPRVLLSVRKGDEKGRSFTLCNFIQLNLAHPPIFAGVQRVQPLGSSPSGRI